MTQAPERETTHRHRRHDPRRASTPGSARFESALKARDVAAAARLFATESYWRDLVAFTWNLKTVEGRDGVADLLTRDPRPRPTPSASPTEEPPDEADGVVTAWIDFETAVGRGRGLLRLTRRTARTRLDPAHHAVRAQGPRGAARHAPADGRRARREQGPDDLEGAAAAGGRELG